VRAGIGRHTARYWRVTASLPGDAPVAQGFFFAGMA
jgi:hypothetical protein